MSVHLRNPLSAAVWLVFIGAALPLGLWGVHAVELAACALAGVVLIAQPSPWEARGPSRSAARFFFALQALYALSFAYSAAFNGIATGPLDFAELPRYALAGVFVVALIRHFDAPARDAVEAAMTAGLYASAAACAVAHWRLPAEDAGRICAQAGYGAALTLCALLFFARSPWRGFHAGVALALCAAGGRASSFAAAIPLSAAAAEEAHRSISLRRPFAAAGAAGAVFAALLSAAALGLRALPAATVPEAGAFPLALAARLVARSPWFGWGPAQYEEMTSVADQYLVWALKGGVPALLLILGGAAAAVVRLLAAPRPRLGTAVLLACVVWLLANGRFLEDPRLFFLTALLACAAAGVEG